MSARSNILKLLEQDPPDVEGAKKALADIDEKHLSPDAASLRLGILDAVNRIDQGDNLNTIAMLLTGIARGSLDDISEIDIDYDMEDAPLASPFEGLGLNTPQRTAGALPGPDQALLTAMAERDSITARKIAGDVISSADMDAYQKTLVDLGKALLPLIESDLEQGTKE